MNRFSALFSVASFLSLASVHAQNRAPIVTAAVADFTEYAGAPARSIDLNATFNDPDASVGVEFTTVSGTFNVALNGAQKPLTTANFLNYVNSGRYFKPDPTTNTLASSFVHRSEPGFVIQGGGYIGTADPAHPGRALPTAVSTFAAIPNEPGLSNLRGTIAMAKLSGNANSATSQWFINLANNTSLDSDGYNNFGHVAGNGMTVVDAIAAVPRFNASSVPGFGPAFASLPLRNFDNTQPIKVANLVSVTGLRQIAALTYSAQSDNTAVATVKLGTSGTNLLVVPGAPSGTAHIAITATDLDGAMATTNFTVTVVPAPGRLVNISTRADVGTGDNVMIGGFIMVGSGSKRVAIRALGPSLSGVGIANPLPNPVLELKNSSGSTIASNDNWQSGTSKNDLIDLGIAPANANEAALVATLPSSAGGTGYTVVVHDAANASGVALVEVYDVDSGTAPTIVNISTRGRVGTGNNVMIGGFIVGGTQSKKVVVRALGPTVADSGIANTLADPVLELRNSQGTLLDSNDNWQTDPHAAEIQSDGLAPNHASESALLDVLPPGNYTAVVSGAGATTGIALVELYQVP